jgi:DNA-binding LacI/PurR family transcriptional regulator
MKTSVTIKDVAKQAGVSVATVSAVVNEHKKKVSLSQESRERVLTAIKTLSYKVNTQARMLRTGRSNTIGVIASDLAQPFTAESVSLIEQEVNVRNYSFLLSDILNSKGLEWRYIDLFKQKQVDGYLFIGASNEFDNKAIVALIENGIPVVLTERDLHEHSVPCILVDNVKGAYLATNHLISKGHERICFISGPESNLITHERLKGYRKALAEKNLTHFEQLEPAHGMGLKHGYDAANKLLCSQPRPTAIFAFNDMLALGAMKALREAGLRIPEDIAIVGFDDVPVAEFAGIPLTTVRQPRVKMCHIGVGMLLDILEHKYPKGYYAKVILPPELIIRQSS